MDRFMKVLFWISLVVGLIVASWFVSHNDIYFHTDLARDFLLFEDIIVSKKPTLIGPRTSMLGVFHGPAWLYLNLPAFILGNGNPVVVGWFWVVLLAAAVLLFYWVAKKLTNDRIALSSTALYALTIAGSAPYLYNPFGAVFLSPLALYLLMRYLAHERLKDLFFFLLTVGFIIQFEMVWGVPLLFLSSILIAHKIVQKKKFMHLSSFAVLVVPLSTFILFDVRHQFIQLKSLIHYVVGLPGGEKQKIDLVTFMTQRMNDMLTVMPSYFSNGNTALTFIFTALITFLLILFFKTEAHKKYPYIGYFLYFYVGFWVLTLPLKGKIYDYYYWSFLPLFCLFTGILASILLKKRGNLVVSFIIFFLLFTNIKSLNSQNEMFFKNNTGLWSFYHTQANAVYKDAKGEFGWYEYTADQYGYPIKYAMNFTQKQNPQSRAFMFQKKRLTYLIIYPSSNQYTNELWWEKDQVKITKKPMEVTHYKGSSYVEKYVLTDGEIKVDSDSSLMKDLTFR